MIPECAAEVAAAGFLFLPSNAFDGLYPESYQMTYHTREYVLDRFSQYFDVLAYLPQGMAGYQDVVVLGRR